MGSRAGNSEARRTSLMVTSVYCKIERYSQDRQPMMKAADKLAIHELLSRAASGFDERNMDLPC